MSLTHLRIPVLVTATLGSVLTLAACSSSSGGSYGGAAGSSPAPSASTSASASASSTSSGGAAATSGKSVTATEKEFSIALSSKTLKPGSYTFHVKNAGSITHALTVDGPGVSDKSTGAISPGASATVTVTLTAGSYEVYCPVGNHKMEGMDETVKVA